MLEKTKNSPFLTGFILSLLAGEYWAIQLMPKNPTAGDWALTLLMGPCFIVVTMFPVAMFVVLLWAVFGWWD